MRLRHFSSVPRRSQTTMRSQPRRFSAQTSALPIKPAPPVTSTRASEKSLGFIDFGQHGANQSGIQANGVLESESNRKSNEPPKTVFNHGLSSVVPHGGTEGGWTRIHTDKNNPFKQSSGRNINSLQVKSTPFPLNRTVQGSKRTLTTESQLVVCQT